MPPAAAVGQVPGGDDAVVELDDEPAVRLELEDPGRRRVVLEPAHRPPAADPGLELDLGSEPAGEQVGVHDGPEHLGRGGADPDLLAACAVR